MVRQESLKGQMGAVERFLALEPRSRVLDLGCGHGRQTLELARRGHRVLGLDPDDAALAQARQSARGEKLNIHFVKNDSRQIPYHAEFDAVVSLSDAFGRFESERDGLRALESVHRALKPGGRLLLDLTNKERLIRHLHDLGDASLDLETGRLEGRRASLRVYSLTEIKTLLARAGLTYRQSFGGFDGAPYRLDSPRLLVLAEKAVERHPPRRAPEPGALSLAIRIKGRRR